VKVETVIIAFDSTQLQFRPSFTHLVLRETVVPNALPPHPCNTYREEYSWQYGYERRLFRKVRQWLEPQRHELIGARGLLSEALSNAYAHGNRRNPELSIIVELVVNTPDYELRVAHSGEGFDVNTVLTRFRNRQHYYNVGGNGLRKFEDSRSFCVYFDRTGQTVHLWYSRKLTNGDLPSTETIDDAEVKSSPSHV
jgi:hypothetical protein